MYAILIISLLLVLGTLKTLQNRKTIIDKVKSETVDALDINNYQDLINQVNSLETRLSSLESSNTELNTTVNTLNAKVNKKCVAKAYTSGSATTMSFNGSDSDWKNISLTNIIKSSDDCGITLENGIIKIDDSKIHTVLVTSSVFFESLTLIEGKTAVIAGVRLPSLGTYTYLTPGGMTFQEIHTATSILNVSSSNNTISLQAIVISGSAGRIRNNPNVTYVTVEVID